MKISKKNITRFSTLFLLLAFVATSGFGCKNPGKDVQEKMKPIELNYWRVWEDDDAFTEIIAAYRALHPNIKINYRKFRYEEYEKELLNALAEDRGPDMFSIPEGWLKKYQTKIAPMPAQITLAYQYEKGGIKKEIAYELRTKNSPTVREIKANFADVVAKNVILDNKVYGLPLSLDTLILFYNKDILNQNGIAQVPETWEDFQKAVEKMVKFDAEDKIVQAGAAIGTGKNINRASDLLSVLMMQNGATMLFPNGGVAFMQGDPNRKDYNPGLKAIQFYLDFASPTKSTYTWNAEMGDSLEAFMAGRVGMVFGYSYDLPTIKAKAPRLNLGIAPIPQVPGNKVNFANYWLETVSKKTANSDAAWDFLVFATEKEQAQKFLKVAKRPTALKSLIASQLEDENMNAPASEILTADNWYSGYDLPAAESALKKMIDDALISQNEKEFKAIIDTAMQVINQTLVKPITTQ